MKKIIIIVGLLLLLSGCEGLFQAPIKTVLQPGNDIIRFNELWIDSGCLIEGKNIEPVTMTTVDTVDSSIVGETIITYTGTYDNQQYVCKRVVKVIDDVAPVITLLPGIDTIRVNQEFIDGGYTVIDNYSTELDVFVENSVNTLVPGTYDVTYTVTDDAGNQAIMIRVVHVLPNE